MADMGLAGSFGAAGAGDAMQTLFDQRMQAAKLKQQADEFQQQQAQQDALTRLKFAEQADATKARLEASRQAETDRRDAAKQQNLVRIDAQLREVPTDTPISQPSMAGMTSAGILPERFTPTPVSAPAPPPGIAADAPTAQQPMPGTVANSPAPNQVAFHRIPTAQELAAKQAAAQKAQDAQDLEAQRASERADNARLIASLKPPPPDRLTKVERKDPTTGKTIIEWLPQSQLAGQRFDKGVGAVTENRLASAEAVTQTGNDIIAKLSSPEYAKKLGPALGRYNTLRDFIGDPPPEFSDLAAAIESYAFASMGVHGMRSIAGADKIKELLDARHTPESMIATIKGLSAFSNHFMENEGRKASGGTKKTAEELLKQYGGG